MKASIFDFNGTMFMDTEFHRLAWDEYLGRLTGRRMMDAEFLRYACGPTNGDILRRFYRADLTDAEIDVLSQEKESVYRRLCRENPDAVRLLDGLPEFLDRLRDAGARYTIATGAGRRNLDFYFETFALERWFDRARVVYDDGTLPGKPRPDVYVRACEVLQTPPRDCRVYEDSFAGIAAAHAAGVGEIVAVATGHPPETLAALPGVTAVIRDFRGAAVPCAV